MTETVGDRAPDNPFNHRRLLSALNAYLQAAQTLLAYCFLFFRVAHTFQRARNIGFGVNEEQATDHHGIAFIQAGANAGLLL